MSAAQFDRAAAATACTALAAGGTALIGTGVASLAAGGSGLVPLTVGAASLFAANYACGPTDVGPNPAGPPAGTSGCIESNGGSFPIHVSPDGSEGGAGFTGYNYDAILNVEEIDYSEEGFSYYIVTVRNINGGVERGERQLRKTGTTFSLRLGPDATCVRDADTLPPPPTDYTTPRPYTDPETNCAMIVTPQGFITYGDGGDVRPVFKIEAAPEGVRNTGGVVGGCNFSPIIHVGGGGDGQPPVEAPWDPEWPDQPPGGTPPWAPIIAGVIGGIVPVIIQNALDQLFAVKYSAGTKEIYAACNYKESGDPETFGVTFPEETYQERVLTALSAIVDFQQQILLWRTPTCATSSPKVGDYRTISFVSDEESPNGKRRLTKRFRYRSSSGLGLDGVVDHWKDFTWSAGAVCVQHRDSQLGSPQVWAASIDEGKRVIQHAAAEAGIDPDQVGRWEVSGSDNPRYGMPGTMRVNTQGGYYWITSRLGPDQRPLVAQT